ncbi:MAG TPA: inositol monophosphatase family protein, partial [Bauldia sp.]|nr:inositol monophosphatase family protein [Bauldia sp.]
RWIVDPLDGTTNFLHGIPIFAISLGLEREGHLVAGVIYNPVMNELYVAERGSGAFLNDRRLRVAGRKELADSVICTGNAPRMREDAGYAGELTRVMHATAGVRRTGSAAIDLAWVASGRFDGYWHHGLSPWDTAAGILVVREAGGYASDARGGDAVFESGSVVAGNELIHRQLLGLMASRTAR